MVFIKNKFCIALDALTTFLSALVALINLLPTGKKWTIHLHKLTQWLKEVHNKICL